MYRQSKSESPPPSSEPSPRGMIARGVGVRESFQSENNDLERKLKDLEARRGMTNSFGRLDYGDYRYVSPPASPRAYSSLQKSSPTGSPRAVRLTSAAKPSSVKPTSTSSKPTSDVSYIQEIVRREVESERRRQEELQKEKSKENEVRKKELDKREEVMMKQIESVKEDLEKKQEEANEKLLSKQLEISQTAPDRDLIERDQFQRERNELSKQQQHVAVLLEQHEAAKDSDRSELEKQREQLALLFEQQQALQTTQASEASDEQKRIQHHLDQERLELAKQKEEVAELIKAHKQQLQEADKKRRNDEEAEDKRRKERQTKEEEEAEVKRRQQEELRRREDQEAEITRRKRTEERQQRNEERHRHETSRREDESEHRERSPRENQRTNHIRREDEDEEPNQKLRNIENRATRRGYHSHQRQRSSEQIPTLGQFDPRDASPDSNGELSPSGIRRENKSPILRSSSPGPEFQIIETSLTIPVNKNVIKKLPAAAKIQFLDALRRDLLQVCHHTISFDDIRVGSLTPSADGFISAIVAISGFGKHIRSSLSVASSPSMKYPSCLMIMNVPSRSVSGHNSFSSGRSNSESFTPFGHDFSRQEYGGAEIIDREAESTIGGILSPTGTRDTYNMSGGGQVYEPSIEEIANASVSRIHPKEKSPIMIPVKRQVESPQRSVRNVGLVPLEVRGSANFVSEPQRLHSSPRTSGPGGPGGIGIPVRHTSRIRHMTPPSQRVHSSKRSNSGTRGTHPNDLNRVIQGTTPANSRSVNIHEDTYHTVVQSLHEVDSRLNSLSPSVSKVKPEPISKNSSNSSDGNEWDSNHFIRQPEPTSSYSSSSFTPPPAKKYIVVGQHGVLVRVGFDLNSSLAMSEVIERGTVIAVSEIINNRALITFPVTGWISVTSQAGDQFIKEL